MYIIPNVSHLDHGLSSLQIDYLQEHFSDRKSFFIETIELPEGMGLVPCGLYGPLMGDKPIPESEVEYLMRGDRSYPSRMTRMPKRMGNKVTVVAGPHEHNYVMMDCMLYTAFSGPVAPKEPGEILKEVVTISERWIASSLSPEARLELDYEINKAWAMLKNSKEFWTTHALSME